MVEVDMSDQLRFSIENSESWIGENADRIDNLAIRSYWQNPYFSSAWLQSWWKRVEGLKTPVLLIVENEKGESSWLLALRGKKRNFKIQGLMALCF